MKRARYRCTETGKVVDVLVAQPDACGVWDISTLPPRPAPPRPPQPWVRPSGAAFWRAQRSGGNPFLQYPGAI